MTPVKWYRLYVNGSLDSYNMYIRRFSEESQCSGAKRTPPATPVLPLVISNPRMSKNSSAHRVTRKKRRKIKKVIKTDPVNACSVVKINPPIVPDTPKMVEFFDEVRNRELRDYYRRMKAAERCSRIPAISPNCRLHWGGNKHPSQNIYCSGAQTLRQDYETRSRDRDCNRSRNLTWL